MIVARPCAEGPRSTLSHVLAAAVSRATPGGGGGGAAGNRAAVAAVRAGPGTLLARRVGGSRCLRSGATRMIDTRRRPVVPPGHPAVAQEGSFNIDTPDNAGDVVFDGESLNGLFAIVEGLQDKVDMLMGVTSTTTTTTTTETVRPTRRFPPAAGAWMLPTRRPCMQGGWCVCMHVGGERAGVVRRRRVRWVTVRQKRREMAPCIGLRVPASTL